MTSHRPLWLRLAPFIFLILWSAGFAIAKIGVRFAEPFTLLALRYVSVVLLLIPAFLIVRPPLPATPRAWLDVAITGFLIQVVYFALCYFAFRSGVSAGGVAIIVCLQPILVGLVAPHFVGEKVSLARWIGLALGLSGAALVILARSKVEAENPLGIVATFIALFGITGGTLYEKRFGVSQHPITANLIQYAVGAVCTVPLAWAFEAMTVNWTPEFLWVMLYLVVGNSLIAITLLLAMIRAGEVSRVSSLFYLVPPLSALFAWPMLGEAMPPLAWGGMVLAAAGVAIASRPAKTAKA